ncbi:MAG: NUDIX domain-containing protein, partial [Candidatus Taylorbacteria bacterium]|nr:NUDIX domain-containing protein [Candidatus Taylorbacteria bacterium]
MEEPFKPRPGQVDFTYARYAPVINCVLKYGDKILLVERSPKMRLYPGLWNGIAGFLDDGKTLEEKVQEEIKEETGLSKEHIVKIF